MTDQEENTDRNKSKYTEKPIMEEKYVETRDRREAKYGKMLFYAFLICILIGIIVVVGYTMTSE